MEPKGPRHRRGLAEATRPSVWSPTLTAWTSRRPIGHATRSGAARTDRRRVESISAIHNAFGAIEPSRECVIDSFLPNDAACFSALVPDAVRPGPSVVESVWTARTFTFQRLHPSCNGRTGTTSSLSDRLAGSARASGCGEERAGLCFGGTALTLDLAPGVAGTSASRRHERHRPLQMAPLDTDPSCPHSNLTQAVSNTSRAGRTNSTIRRIGITATSCTPHQIGRRPKPHPERHHSSIQQRGSFPRNELT